MKANISTAVFLLLTATPAWGFAPPLPPDARRAETTSSSIISMPVTRRPAASSQIATVTTDRDAERTTTTTDDKKSKEERFVEWMTTDNWTEVPHPGIELPVQGTIPSYVKGMYIKNGPGAFATRDCESRRYTHAFDGLAKLQKFDISPKENKVVFTTRYIESKVQRGMMEENRIPGHLSVGPVEPPFAWWDVLLHTMEFDNTCVNFEELSRSGTFCAVTDAVVRNQIDPTTLETVGRLPAPAIDGLSSPPASLTQFSTAHSKVAHRDGCTYNYYLENGLISGNYAHMVRTNPDLTQTSIGKIPVGGGRFSYVHEISVSENYAILVLHPLFVNLGEVLRKGYLLPTLEYDPTKNTQICLFDLDQVKPVQIFEAPPCWCYHHVNAYEDKRNNTLVLDLIAYETAGITNGPHAYLYMDNMRTGETRDRQEREGVVWRFTLDLTTATTTNEDDDSAAATQRRRRQFVQPEKKVVYDPETKLPLSLELVSVAPDRQGKPYRYVYGFTGFHQGKSGYMDWAIRKQDVEKNERNGVWYEDGMYPGEVSFVRNPQGTEEDDGVLLSTVFDSRRGENCLLVLDASTMKELARAYTGVSFPQSFHGKFYHSIDDE